MFVVDPISMSDIVSDNKQMKETITPLEQKADAILSCQSTTATSSDATPSKVGVYWLFFFIISASASKNLLTFALISKGSYGSKKTILEDSDIAPVKFLSLTALKD
jgi:hypothetical protein